MYFTYLSLIPVKILAIEKVLKEVRFHNKRVRYKAVEIKVRWFGNFGLQGEVKVKENYQLIDRRNDALFRRWFSRRVAWCHKKGKWMAGWNIPKN